MESRNEATSRDGHAPWDRLKMSRARWIALGTIIVVLLLWVVPVLIEAVGSIDIDVNRPYLLIFTFVTFDAVVPILPSESLLTVASTLAASQGELTLAYIILAGGLGAVVGDSLLYWISRRIAGKYLSDQVERAMKNEKVAVTFDVLGQSAPQLIVVGRFVPGVRFAVNATMGVTRYPYSKFLLFSAIGGFTWSVYTCVITYWLGQSLGDYPIVSMLTSALLTTVFLVFLFIGLKRRLAERKESLS